MGVVDVVFEVWIVDKLQLDVGGVFHFSFSIHGILESQQQLSAPHSDTTGPVTGSTLFLPNFVLLSDNNGFLMKMVLTGTTQKVVSEFMKFKLKGEFDILANLSL